MSTEDFFQQESTTFSSNHFSTIPENLPETLNLMQLENSRQFSATYSREIISENSLTISQENLPTLETGLLPNLTNKLIYQAKTWQLETPETPHQQGQERANFQGNHTPIDELTGITPIRSNTLGPNHTPIDELTGIAQITSKTSELNHTTIDNKPTTPNQTLQTGITTALTHLTNFTNQPNSTTKLQQIFPNIPESIDNLINQAINTITIIDSNSFPANGAYSIETNTIYISQQFLTLNSSNPETIATVIIEEIGHYIDAYLNPKDTPGDEGEIFASLVTKKTLSDSELLRIKTEDDTTTITLNNQQITIEQNPTTVPGLKAEYFNNLDLTDYQFTRTDNQIDFDWSTDTPDPNIENDTWSVRWTGQIEALYTEEYTFTSAADDGMRVWINNQLIIDNWDDGDEGSSTRTKTGTINLVAGEKADIKVEYRDRWWTANAQLYWESISQTQQIVPESAFSYTFTPPPPPGNGTGLKAEYFDNLDLTNPILTRTDNQINFDWSTDTPDPNIENDTWSVRWTGQIEALYTEEYTFTSAADDGMRVWINNQLIIDNWDDGDEGSSTRTKTGTINLVAGEKADIKVEYYDRWWTANAQLYWESTNQFREIIPQSQLYEPETLPPPPPGNGTGLTAEYFDNLDFSNHKFTRTDPIVDFSWGNSPPDTSMGNDTFSIRWTGQIEPLYSQTYTFTTNSDDGVRLWLNDNLIIDNWTDNANSGTGTIDLSAGEKYDLKLEYYDRWGEAKIDLKWSSDSQAVEVIPTTQLYPTATTTILPDAVTQVPGNNGEIINTTVTVTARDASTSNEYGFFLVDDPSGRVDNLLPGDVGYAAAALASSRRLLTLTNNETTATVALNSGSYLGTYLIGNGTTAEFFAQNPDNLLSGEPKVYFSLTAANPDSSDHNNQTTINEYQFTQAWEDLVYNGDYDFNDLIVQIDFEQPVNNSPNLEINNVTVVESDSETTDAVFTVSLDSPSNETVTVDFTTVDDTARAGEDYLTTSGTITFNPGETTQNITVSILDDLVAESTESFQINLSNSLNAVIEDNQGLGTIIDDDELPSLSINDISTIEGDGEPNQLQFTVNLSLASNENVTVDFTTIDDTAIAGSDYQAINGTLTFVPGETSKTITVEILGDTEDELDETLTLQLSNSTNAVIEDNLGLGTIIDDDDELPRISVSALSTIEGDGEPNQLQFTVNLSLASNENVTVDFTTIDDTAIAGSDYQAVNGTLTFEPGETTKIIAVEIIGDIEDELDETLTLQLTNPSNAVIEDSFGIGTIIDDDQLINNEIILSEDSNFQTTYQQTLEIPANPSQLSFSFADLNFDTSDLNFINDAFEAALVDSEGNSLVHTIGETKNAFINFTESQAPKLADGVTLDNTTVTVNLSYLEPQTPATLILRLINDDSDTTTSVRITNIELQPSDSTIVPTVTPTIETASDRQIIDFNLLSDVSPSILSEYGQTSFNPQTQILSVELGLNNAGTYWFNSPLLVAVTQISDPSIQVLKADGTTPEGLPYYDFSNLVTEGTLAPSQSTASQLIHFFNPENIQFTYELVVLSQLNVAPIIESKPNKEILGGQPYSYQVIATDANDDELSYSLLVAPLGMTIDPATGLINWQTNLADVANHSLVIEVSDSKGGKTQQNFTLAVLGDTPNRPPNFTSTPVVDAWINQPYNYDADAIDPDQDNLNYSIIKGPDGLTVNSQTGNVEWTPPAVVVLGDTVLGQISLPGEQDEFSFSGSRGQRIYFDPLRFSGSTYDWDFQVFSPSGEQLVNTDLSYYNNKLLTLPENGNYRVVVSTSDDTTGNYGFSVIDIAQVPVAELDSLIEGQLAPGSEDDIYRFTASVGQKLFIDQISNSGSLDWVLYGPDNQVVSSSNYSDMELYLPEDGEYLLSLRGKSSFTSNVEYAFEIITPDEVENEISIGSHLAPVVVTDAIAEKGEEDLYTFTGTPGQRLYFDRYFRNSTNSYSHTASIISPSGEEILGYIFSSSDPEPLTLKEAGTYTVIIDAVSEYTGSYSFSLLDPDLATEIDLDTNISGTIEPGQATHAYQFNGTAGQHLYFDSVGGTSYTNWTLYDSGNNQLTTAYFNRDLEIVLDDSDTYTLLIQGDNSSSAVNYNFTVITPDTVTAPLNLDTTVTGAISEKGEQDVYTFTGTQGQHLFLDTLIDTSNLNATLLDPSGNSVFNTSMYADSYRDPVILPESGTYQLIIDGTREATANYSFRLTDLTAAPILDLETPTSGIIEPGSEIKVYRLNANSGERLYFQGQASSYNPNWLLYSPGNEELINRQLDQDFEYVFSSDGVYYLILRGDGSTSDRFDYTLQVIPSTDTTSSLNPNTLVSAEITTLGEQHNYTFTGNAGQQLYFNAIAGDSNLTAILRNPSGNIVWSGTTADDSIPIILTSDSTYELNIDGKNEATGSYNFKLLTAAAPLSLSSPTSGSISAQETALYQFNGTAGQQLSFENLTAVAGAEWTIYSQVPLLNGTTVIDSDSFDSNLAVVLPSNGSYTLAVRNLSETQLNYEFQVIDTSTAPIGNNGVETLHSGNIAVAGEVDNYTFTADAGTLVYFDGQQGSNIVVKLSAPDGSNVFNGKYASYDDGAFFLAQTGTYTLEVNGTGSNTGNYSFKLVELTNASNLNLNTITNVPLVAKETKAYQFTGTVGQKIHFDGLNESNPSITARLLNANGRQIAYISDLRSNIDLQTLPGNGTYYLILQSNSTSTKTASFQILDDNNATPLILDSEISGDFGTSKRESQLYKFTANAGQRLYFDHSEGDYYYSLYAPDGKKLFDSNFSSDYEIDILPSDGEYTLVVSGYGYSNDNYRLRVVTPDEITTPMTVNNTVTGELLELGEQHIYTFTGNNNQRLFFDSLTGTGGITAQLFSPSGKTVISTNVNSDEEPVMLSETGTYRLVIDGRWDDIGTYSFRLLDWTSTTPISFDTPISGDFGLSQRETHLYRFSGTEGQELFFNQTAGGYWNYYILYGTDGKQVFNQRLSSDKELTLPYTGDYILALQGRGSSNDTYELEIVTPESLTNTLTFGETISSSISEAGETDSYTLAGTPGQILYFDSLFASSYSINAQLFTPSGKQLWNQVVGGDRQPFILPEVGTYTLKIARESTNNDITDSYSFRLLDFSQATPVNFDTSLSGNFGLSQRETHLYTLTGTEGQELFFDRTQGDYYNRYTLYDQFGQIILDQHLDRDKEVILPNDGTYYLALRSFGDSNDNYQLEVVTPSALVTPLNYGETISSEITEPGERDLYNFTGTEGEVLYFDSLKYQGTLRAKLIAQDGKEIWNQYVINDKVPFVLPSSGTYTLEINATENNDETGSYDFRLLNFAEATELTLDSTISGDFSASQRETVLYRFIGNEGDYLYFDSVAGSSNDYYTLYNADRRVFNQRLSHDSELELTVTGEYILALRSDGSELDNYKLKINTPELIATTLTLGEAINSEISESGEKDTYTFVGAVGQKLFFDTIEGNSSLKARLFSPTDLEVIDNHLGGDWQPFTLTEAGTYRLEIDGSNNIIGDYGFVLRDRSFTTPLELNTPTTGTLELGNDVDIYRFEGRIGQVLNFDLDAQQWSNANWVLYQPDNRVLVQPSGNQPDFKATLPSDGLYTLAISGSSNSPVSYDFQVIEETQMPVISDGLNVVESGTISEGNVDEYTFTANAGTKIFYDSQTNTPGHIRTSLIAPDNSYVVNNSYSSSDWLQILEQTGEYKLQVSSTNNTTTDDYQFQLLELPKDLTSTALNPLELNSIVAGEANPSLSANIYSFEGNIGQQILFNQIDGWSELATLYNPNGSKVFSRYLQQKDSEIITLTQEGMYHLLIQGRESQPQDYSFQMLDFGFGLNSNFNVPVSGFLPSGQQGEVYKFMGTEGTRLFFDSIKGTSTNYWKLYGPDNVIVDFERLDLDFEVELPSDGSYTLYIEGGNSASAVDYEFRIINHDDSIDIITPGTGERGSSEEENQAIFPVRVQVEDEHGDLDVQEYNIRVGADPDNAAPAIISTPPSRYGLNQKAYRYQIEAVDPDRDELAYQLLEGPNGAVVSRETGEVIWFPESVQPGDSATFTVAVTDGRGGTDSQSFTVDVEGALGKIQGAVFEDLNNNGYRDTTLVKGDNPDLVFVIDVSGSTGGDFVDWETADIETVAEEPMGILGMEIATAVALSEQLILQGRGDTVKIGVIPFNNGASILDMNPATPEVDLYTTPLADNDNNGIRDLRQVINGLSAEGGTNFTSGLEVAQGWLDSLSGDPNIIFLSDGFGGLNVEIVEELNADNVNITAFGIGSGAEISQLRRIDPDAIQVTDPQEIIDIFSGWDNRYTTEPLIEGVTVYLDLNDNGELDFGEPQQVTQKNNTESLLGSTPFYFNFDNLLPGEYKLRQVIPNGYAETAPSSGVWTDTITTEGETIGHLFGLHQISDPPNAAPVFTSTVPTDSIKIGNTLQYLASAIDVDADIVSYDLTLKPEGMTVDEETGTLLWKPTVEQVGTFNAILRVSDGKGGQDLQYLAVETILPNNAPVFTSVLPENANAKVGRQFKYQAVAIDADGDSLTYSLNNAPSTVTIDAETGLLSWTPTTVVDNLEFEIKATDDRAASTVQKINLTVNPAPLLPPLNLDTVPQTAVKIGSAYTYQLPSGFNYHLTAAPEGMTVSESGLVSWNPTQSEIGLHDVVIEVTDNNGDRVLQSWQVEVSNLGVNRLPVIITTTDPNFANQPPEILSSPRMETRSGKTYLYQLADAVDPDGDSLTFELISGPSGMEITQSGLLNWSPTPDDFGYHNLAVAISDGQWQTVQSWSLFVSNQTTNRPPSITSVPKTVTNIERLYQYQLESFDPDGDLMLWSLDEAPTGMVVNPETGMLTWQPKSAQIGTHPVSVRVTDTEGTYVGQGFELRVTGINTPPQIVSTPITQASPQQNYTYQIIATDPENDTLEFALGLHPAGMHIDAKTGLIEWLPTADQLGEVTVEVLVTDTQGATNRQNYTLVVSEEAAVNNAPVIVSTPVYRLDVASVYSYDVDATDPDGDSLTYQLISAPEGLVLNEETGEVSWSNPTLGNHSVVVGATDGNLGAAQGFILTVSENAAPIFNDTSIPPTAATPGKLYSYDIKATDPNGEQLHYSLDEESRALGMVVDQEGRLRWTPTPADTGSHEVTISVADGTLETVEQTFTLTVVADTIAPVVDLRPLSGYYLSGEDYLAQLGEEVTFSVKATDNINVTGLQLSVDGVAIPLDGNGITSVSFNTIGETTLTALAVDAAGNTGYATLELLVQDFNDVSPPVAILAPQISDNPITAPTDIIGTVTDEGEVEYILEVAPQKGGEFVEIARGDSAVNDGKLGKLDTSLLENGSYILRLTATDSGGNSAIDEVIVDVTGELKLGNFQLSFTDLEIPVAGIPISLTRTYDSLGANRSDNFGYGWRLEFRDTDLQTSARKRTAQEELLGIESAFSSGEKVYLTLPGGERTGFTFKPKGSILNQYLLGFLGSGAASGLMYHPEFVADDGSDLTLRVKNAQNTYLIRKAGSDEYVEVASAVPYNPAATRFGGVYILETGDGVEYEIDADSGDLITVTDTNDNQLSFSEGGIFSDTGVGITFERDNLGRIVGVVDPEGNKIKYEYDLSGDLVGVIDRSGNRTGFEYDEERKHYLTEIIDPLGRSGVRSEYDQEGRLKRIIDVNGEAVELVYDPDNSLQTVRDVFGNETIYEYDERGNVVTEIDAVGLVTQRSYDDDNNLKTETLITDESGVEGWTTRYSYDEDGNKLSETDALGNVTRWTYNKFGDVLTKTNPLGYTTTNTYDSKGNLLTETNAEGETRKRVYDVKGNITSLIDAEGRETKFEYDLFGQVTHQIDTLGNETTYTYNANGIPLSETKTVTTAEGIQTQTTSWTYDTEGNVISETRPSGDIVQYEYDSLGNRIASVEVGVNNNRRTEYEYDNKNQVTKVLYPDGTSESFIYDEAGREIAIIDAAGHTTNFIYDPLGRVIETIYADNTPEDLNDSPRSKTEYDQVGRVVAAIDELGNRTEYKYDAVGRLILVRNAEGNETKYTYNAAGRRLTETDARNYTTEFIYDKVGRLVKTKFADGTFTTTAYNDVNFIASETNQAGQTTYFTYDDLDRLIEVIHPDETPSNLLDNPRTKTEYDELGRTTASLDELGNRTEYEYDLVGRQTLVRDAEGNEITYTYDNAGNLFTETDPNGHTTRFVYDELDRLKETHFHDGTYITTTYNELGQEIATTDQAGKTTQFEYNSLGRLTAVIDAAGQRTEYTYDLAGNHIATKDANNHLTQYEYDELNRRTLTILPMSQHSETTYDEVGNVISFTDFNGDTIEYEYNELNQLTTKEFPNNTSIEYTYTPTGQIKTVTDSLGTTTYDYDVRDRLIEQINPDSQFIRYTYDDAGNRTRVITNSDTVTYTYNQNNRLETVTSSLGTTQYSYDAAGNLIQTEFPNNTAEIRTYDDLNRLNFLKNLALDPDTGEETGIISSYDYTLDNIGNRIAVEEDNGRIVNYDYDDLYRLTQEAITDGGMVRTIDYTYDAVGNRLSRDDSQLGLTTYIYNDNDWLLSEEINGEVTTYTYDNNGNTLSQLKDVNEQTIYTWDYENHLQSAEITTDTGTTVTEYKYNTDGVRIASIVDGVETRYLVDANHQYAQVLEEYTTDGTVEVAYVYGHDLISQVRDDQESFYHVDGLGSTRALSDASGNVSDVYIYDAYGNVISSSGSTVNSYLYTGEQYDSNLEDYYLRARYYDPSIGRFTARDPFEGWLSEPLSLAKYPYVHGNPVNATDPSGLFLLDLKTALSIATQLASRATQLAFRTTATTTLAVYIAHQVNLAISRAKVKTCAVTGDKNCSTGIPIVFYGQTFNGLPLYETTEHIRTAIIFDQRPAVVSAYSKKPSDHGSDGWYKNKGKCREKAQYKEKVRREKGINIVNRQIGCDEYPFNRVEQGGLKNYNAGLVSLRLVPVTESPPQGQLMNDQQLKKAGVVKGDPFKKWFGVVPVLELPQSFWRKANINR